MRLGRLLPLILALGAVLDGGTRLMPIDLFAFRAWEALLVGGGVTGPFDANRVYANPLTHGDLARPRRFAYLRQRHLEYFSTDAWGFRNTVFEGPDSPPRWLLVGDSFGAGSGVTDRDTLASQIARLSGERVYNASGDFPVPFTDIRFTSQRLGMTSGTVVFEYLERQDMPTVASASGARRYTDGPPPATRGWSARYASWRKSAGISRMSIVAGWGWDALAAPLGLTSAAESAERPAELPTEDYALFNGQRMLFYGWDIDVTRNPFREIPGDYLVWLKSELAQLNLDLIVLLVPTKYSVYGPLVTDRNAVRPSKLPLERLTANLTARGVAVVNVTDLLRRHAADGLSKGEYVYFIDDTHWNARGIDLAAQAVVEAARGR
jgi:hypothetical protein